MNFFIFEKSFSSFCILSQNDLVSDWDEDQVSLFRGALFLPHLLSDSNKVKGQIPSQLKLNVWEATMLFVTTSMEIKDRGWKSS